MAAQLRRSMEHTSAAVANSSPPPAGIVRRFRLWAQRASDAERAEGASALARAWLHAGLEAALRAECAVALAGLLDDPQVAVRRAMAEAFAAARCAPRALVVALANDCSEVAAPLLARSPLLTEAELVDCVAAGDVVAQCAVARRPGLGPGPAAALCEVAPRVAALALIANPDAALTSGALRRLLERRGDDPEILQALAVRAGLPAEIEAEIAIAAAGEIAGPGERRARLRAERDAALAAIAAGCSEDDMPQLVATLRLRGALTLALLLRSLLGGERGFFAAALADLTGLAPARAGGLVRDPHGAGFGAAALKAGLPPHALPLFRAALAAIAAGGAGEGESPKADLVGAVTAACEDAGDPALAPYRSLLRRFAAEAARAEARAGTRSTVDLGVLPPSLARAAANDDAASDGLSMNSEGIPSTSLSAA